MVQHFIHLVHIELWIPLCVNHIGSVDHCAISPIWVGLATLCCFHNYFGHFDYCRPQFIRSLLIYFELELILAVALMLFMLQLYKCPWACHGTWYFSWISYWKRLLAICCNGPKSCHSQVLGCILCLRIDLAIGI